MKHALLIYSGGMDSTSMLHEYADEIALAVTFHYGSNHNEREAECARKNCAKLKIELIEIDLAFIGQYFKSSLLEGGDAIPEGNYDDQNMQSTVVPFRNGIMLSIASGLAESRGLDTVMMANHGGDHAIYPDCRSEFVSAMSEAIAKGTYEGIGLYAPYTGLSKGDVARRGAAAGVNFADTYSCYKGGAKHCGKCATCRERIEALAEAGIVDETEYEDQNADYTAANK